MGFFKKLIKRKVIFNFLAALLFVAISVIATIYWLGFYTHHGEAIAVPDFSGYTTDEAFRIAEEKNLIPQILDSVYYADKEPGTIVAQYPEANHNVKRDRLVLFTVNANEPDKVELPDLTGISVRQATADAELVGFKIGKLSYVPDISTTVVYVTLKGKKIKAGTKLPKGTIVDLTVGRGTSKEKTTIPKVIGLTFSDAESSLLENYLNPGSVSYDKTVTNESDSLKAKVWKQYPRSSGETEVSLGTYVDLWLTLDKDLIPETENENNNEESE